MYNFIDILILQVSSFKECLSTVYYHIYSRYVMLRWRETKVTIPVGSWESILIGSWQSIHNSHWFRDNGNMLVYRFQLQGFWQVDNKERIINISIEYSTFHYCYAHTRAHTHAHTRTRTHTRARTHTHTHTHTRTYLRTHSCSHAHTCRRENWPMGISQYISASNHVIRVCLLSQSALEKHNQEKSPQTFAHLVHLSNKCIVHVW